MAARKPTSRSTRTNNPDAGAAKKKAGAAAPKKKAARGRELITRELDGGDELPKKHLPMAPLTGKQRRALRALGHHLEPVVIVGGSGVTDGVISAVDQALKDHELIKVKIHEGPEDRKEAAEKLAEGTGSALAQVLGRTALLYRPDPDEPKIEV